MKTEMRELGKCGVEVYSGQIMSRITPKEGSTDDVLRRVKVIIPKSIHEDGTIVPSEMAEENIKIEPDKKRITEVGDIVLKLSTPYDAGLVDEDSAGAVIPSFCALIKNSEETLTTEYLLACLNSSVFKDQMRQSTAGQVMSILSVGKVKSAVIPVPSMREQKIIGNDFISSQKRLRIIKQIGELEAKRNNIIFRDLVRKYDE